MSYPPKRFWLHIISLLCFVGGLFYLGSTEKIKPEVFIGLMVAGITAFVSTMTHFHNSDKFFKELFTEFNSRYDKMNGFLISIHPEQKLENEARLKIVDYLNLCAEEYMWVKRGRIPVHIWKSWKNGINQYLKNPVIRQVFEEEKALWKSSYYGFFEELE